MSIVPVAAVSMVIPPLPMVRAKMPPFIAPETPPPVLPMVMSPSTELALIARLKAVIDLVALMVTEPAPAASTSASPSMPLPWLELIVPVEVIWTAPSPEPVWAWMPAVALPLLSTVMLLPEATVIAPSSLKAAMPALPAAPCGLAPEPLPVTSMVLPAPVVIDSRPAVALPPSDTA